MRVRCTHLVLVFFASSGLACSQAQAVVIASDNANDPVYSDGWDVAQDEPPVVGDNGGMGFGPWRGLSESPPNYGGGPLEIDLLPQPDNDLGSPAFRIGNGFAGFIVDRPFATPLQVGESFSIAFDTYPIFPNGGQILISFKNEDGVAGDGDERIAFYAYYYNDGSFIFGTDNWGVNAETANDNLNGGASLPQDPLSGIDYQTNYTTTDASDGFTLTLDIETVDTYRLRVEDDNETKLDISGQMHSTTAGELINEVSIFGDVVTDFSGEQVVYFNNLMITAPDVARPGDFNGDTKVDAADYTLWRDHLGSADDSVLMGNGDQTPGVGVGDYEVWQTNFGEMVPPGSLASAAHGVPEPTAGWLAAAAMLLYFGGCRVGCSSRGRWFP